MRGMSAGVVIVACVLTASVACAEPALDIVAPGVERAFPEPGTPLPTNAQLVLLSNASAPAVIEVVRTFADRPEEQLVVARVGRDPHLAFLADPGVLSPQELLVVDARCPGCFFVAEWPIGDGPDDSAPSWDPGSPAIFVRSVSSDGLFPQRLGYALEVRMPPVRDEGPVLLRVAGDEVDGFLREPVQAGPPVVRLFAAGPESRRFCFRVTAVDAAGHEAAFPEEICAELDPALGGEGGCAAASGPACALVLLVVGLFSRRSAGRRRAGPHDG
jgi:hypothetical protein